MLLKNPIKREASLLMFEHRLQSTRVTDRGAVSFGRVLGVVHCKMGQLCGAQNLTQIAEMIRFDIGLGCSSVRPQGRNNIAVRFGIIFFVQFATRCLNIVQ